MYLNDPVSTTETKEQLEVYSWCQELGLDVEMERECPPYYIDIYLPELRLGIELDGSTHSRFKDAKRDAFIKRRHNIDIWRIKNKHVSEDTKQDFFQDIVERAKEYE